jgi:hypothetical protein
MHRSNSRFIGSSLGVGKKIGGNSRLRAQAGLRVQKHIESRSAARL